MVVYLLGFKRSLSFKEITILPVVLSKKLLTLTVCALPNAHTVSLSQDDGLNKQTSQSFHVWQCYVLDVCPYQLCCVVFNAVWCEDRQFCILWTMTFLTNYPSKDYRI